MLMIFFKANLEEYHASKKSCERISLFLKQKIKKERILKIKVFYYKDKLFIKFRIYFNHILKNVVYKKYSFYIIS